MHKCTQITTYAWVSRVEKPCIYRVNSVHKKGQHQFYAHKLSVLFIYQYFVLCFALCTKNKVFIGLPIIRSCFLLIKSYLYIFFFKNISNLLPDIPSKLNTFVYFVYFYLKNIQINILNLLLDTHSISLILYICIFFFSKSFGFIWINFRKIS